MRRFASLLLIALAAWPYAHAADRGEAAHFFTYRPVPGQGDKFEAGYRTHLGWHRTHRDPLVWYGWTIADGPREGLFVDATVGAPFAAFDHRVAEKEDGANFAATTAPYVTPITRGSYVLLRALSTGTPLEDHHPSATMQVLRFELHPGHEAAFERALRSLHAVLLANSAAPVHTWYRLRVGGASEYMLLVARDDWASYDRFDRSPADLLAGDAAASRDYADAVAATSSETWSYAPELSYLP